MPEKIYVDNVYYTNQPWIIDKPGGSKRYLRVPDPAKPPTEAYLICTDENGRRTLHTIKALNQADLEQRIADFCEEPGVEVAPGGGAVTEKIKSKIVGIRKAPRKVSFRSRRLEKP